MLVAVGRIRVDLFNYSHVYVREGLMCINHTINIDKVTFLLRILTLKAPSFRLSIEQEQAEVRYS